MLDESIAVAALGWLARDALVDTRGRARVVAALARSAYLRAGDALIWIGGPGSPLHGRAAVACAAVPPSLSGDVMLDIAGAPVWRPDDATVLDQGALTDGARSLLTRLREVGTPEGFATLLTGEPLRFPFAAAAPTARELALASHDDDAGAATRAATHLIGLGPGLTPAGDDYIGGMFFARTTLGPAEARGRWRAAGEVVGAHAHRATHPISAVLLADLVAGRGHAPLHDLAHRLATGAPTSATLDAARRLARIGHSSGWDIMAGLIAALVPPSCWHFGFTPPP